MLEFNKIRIVGFGSIYEETEISLNQKQTILIKAPNGSGKSTIFSALTWVLYGKTLKGRSDVNTWKRYQGKDYHGTKVEIFFTKDSKVYKVIRCQNYTGVIDDGAKGKDRLLIYRDAELLDIKGKTKIQEFLVDEIGMSYKLFTNSIMFGEDVQRIITESNADKKKLFEEVFNLNFLNVAQSIASKEYKDLYNKIQDINKDLSHLQREYESARDTYKDIIDREKSFLTNLRKERKELKEERTLLVKSLIETKKGYSEEKENLVECRLGKTINSLQKVNKELEKARRISKVPLLEVIDKVIKLLKRGESEKALTDLKRIKKAFKDIEELTDERESINVVIQSLRDKKRELYEKRAACDKTSAEITEVDEQILHNKKEKLKIISPKYKEKCQKLKKEMKKVEESLSSYKAKAEDYNWLVSDPLSNNGIKAFLFDSCLRLLNNTLGRYSEILGFRISFEVDLESKRKDFVTLIERDEHVIDYDELSQGEKQLCDVAMAFAMNESLTNSHGINLALLDEVFEHLDDENIDLVISLIQQVYEDRSLFIITHKSSLPLSNVKTLQVVKVQGHSTVKIL